MVKISFLGSCREIGRSGILVESKSGSKCLLDYGIGFNNDNRLPLQTDISNLKAIALTHSHIDHSGALPFIYKTCKVPLFTNSISLEITELLIRDMIRISKFPYPFGFRELDYLKQHTYFLENGIRQRIDDNFYLTFIDAGHIPGSVSILLEVDNKRLFYSGDINTQKTNLITSANYLDVPQLDAVIIESTYALKEHPPRKLLEDKFVERVINVTENGGTVLIPAFGVARSQEALLILEKYNYSGKIFIDGLARKVSNIYLNHPKFIKDIKAFRRIIKRTHFIKKRKDRIPVKKSSGVIISPSGMLKGGAAIDYIEPILNDPNSAIYLVGYQVEGSPGRGLLDNGIFEFQETNNKKDIFKNLQIEAKCDYDYFDFSSHADSIHLYEYIENLNFQNKNCNNIFCIHGDNKSTTTLASELVKNGYNSVAPEIGEIYQL
ncbi:MAG: MBL fold metallo-hydrolase [Promethearchaeota archaeon]|nr:MAG: MBL fold metallo-hydrolase [Candidatus Lokiarchaeota archaeon]